MNRAVIGASVLLGLSAASCQLVVEVREYVIAGELGGGGTGGAGGDGATGGQGGAGGSTGTVCTPLEEHECYTGPAATLGIGTCKAGKVTCNKDGTAFGPCEGAVVPTEEKPEEIGDEACDGYAPGEPVWWRTFGNELEQWPDAIASDKEGSVYVCGSFEGTLQFDETPALVSQGGTDIFLVKFDSSGKAVWSRRFGNWKDQQDCHMAADDLGVTVAGTWEGEMYFGGLVWGGDYFRSYAARFDMSGSHVWSVQASFFIDQELSAIASLPDGDAILVGTAKDAHQDGGDAPFAARLANGDGVLVWSKLLSEGLYDTGYQAALDVATDSSGNIAVIGNYEVPQHGKGVVLYGIAPNGTVNDHKEYPLLEDDSDCFVQSDLRIAFGPSQEVVVSGSFWCTLLLDGFVFPGPTDPLTGSGDIFWAKIASNWTVPWAHQFSWSNELEQPLRFAVDSAGGVTVAAFTEDAVDFGGGPFGPDTGTGAAVFAKVTTGGEHAWTKSFAGGMQGDARLAARPDGSTAFAASFSPSVVIGVKADESAGARDLVIGCLAP